MHGPINIRQFCLFVKSNQKTQDTICFCPQVSKYDLPEFRDKLFYCMLIEVTVPLCQISYHACFRLSINVTLRPSTFCFNDGKRQWLCATTVMCVVCSKVIQLRHYRSCSLFSDRVSHICYFQPMLNKYKIFKNTLQRNKPFYWTLISALQSCVIRRCFDRTLDRI